MDRYLDSDTATALNGVKITLVGNNTTTTVLTNTDGSFNFDGLKDGRYLLDISDDNYASMNVSIRMIGDDIDLGNILLNKNQNSTISTIKGVIKNQTTGLPIEGALVSIGSQKVLSDSAGNYLISSVAVGEYILNVQKSGYLNTNAHISVPPNTLLHYNALLKENDFNIISSIKGTIVDKVSQTGLVGVSIILTGENSRNFTTLSDGNFIFENITLGDYKLEIKKDGYYTVISNISINQSEIIDVGIILLKLNDALTDTITLSGTVSQIINNTPIQNALISVGGLSVYSDEFGNYEITNIPLGNLFVEVSNAQYLPYTKEFQINEATTLILSPKLQKKDSDIAIFGTIFDVNSSKPLSDVTIEYIGEDNTTVITDANGYYFISPVTAGSVNLTYKKYGYETISLNSIVESKSINISPRLSLLQTDNADNNALIQGIVLNSTTNQAVAGVKIHLLGDFTDEIIYSNSDGSFTFNNILSYGVTLTFTHETYKTVDTMVNLQRDELFDIGQVRMRPLSADKIMPDLVISDINTSAIDINSSELVLSGDISVRVSNIGNSATESAFSVLAYYDNNNDGNYTAEIDNLLGQTDIADILNIDANVTKTINLTGALPFVNAPISIWVDSGTQIVESDEINNIANSSDNCKTTVTSVGEFNPVVKWHWDGSGSSYPDYDQVMSSPMVGQLTDDNNDGVINNDDIPDIVFTSFKGYEYSYNGVLRAISGDDGHEIFSVFGVTPFNAPALGDIDNDGKLEIIVGKDRFRGLKVFENDGTLKWYRNIAYSGEIAIADIDNDGYAEIIFRDTVLDHLGNTLWNFNASYIPIAVNLNDNPNLEIITDGIAYNSDGNVLWDSGYRSDSIYLDSFSAIGNFDEDKYPEIVFVNNGTVILHEHDGTIKWGPVSIPGGGNGGAPTVADMDGDGKPEIGVAGRNYYVVFEDDGSVKWKSKTRDYSTMTGSTVFDFEGDGKAEILYNDELKFRIYDGQTGQIRYEIDSPSSTVFEYPVIADIDNDNHAEILLVSNNFIYPGTTGLRVLEDATDSWMPTRSIWNQHSYHITNINDDGTIPRVEEPSWLTHNSYRLNTFVDRDATSSPDLSVSSLKLIENKDANLSLFVRVGNGGSDKLRVSTNLSFYDGDPANGGTLIADHEITTLDKNSYADIIIDNVDIPINDYIYVKVDSNDKIKECDEIDNQMSIPAIVYKSIGEISVFTDFTIYNANQLANFTTTSINYGKLDANFRSQLVLKDEHNNTVQNFNSIDLGVIDAGLSKDTTQTYNTATILSGTYYLYATLYDKHNNQVAESSTTFNIISDSNTTDLISLSLESEKTIYSTNDTIFIESFIDNLSLNSILRNATLELEVKHSVLFLLKIDPLF